jgi:SAM-dependent methyltransferase
MSVTGDIHGRFVAPNRVQRLKQHLVPLLKGNFTILDVGCGDGALDEELQRELPGSNITGVDVLVRGNAKIPVQQFDGVHLPFGDKDFDIVLFVDVLHHTEKKLELLREAARVAKKAVVIKDHVTNGWLSFQVLKFMDYVGNYRHGVALPYLYWNAEEWRQAFRDTGLQVEQSRADLHLYSFPASMVFDRSLHFIASLTPVGHSASKNQAD